MQVLVIAILGLVNIVYILIGGLVFSVLETPNEHDKKEDFQHFMRSFLDNYTCIDAATLNSIIHEAIVAYDSGYLVYNATDEIILTLGESHWNILDSVYFATTVVTTIGYGHVAPVTGNGRIFCVFFALLGIPLCLTMLIGIGEKLNHLVKKLVNKVTSKEKPQKQTNNCIILICIVVFGSGFFVLIPAAMFMAVENWSYGQSVYYAIITLLTVGFGDVVAGNNDYIDYGWWYVLSVGCWIFIGLAWGATVISIGQEMYQAYFRRQSEETQEEHSKFKTACMLCFG